MTTRPPGERPGDTGSATAPTHCRPVPKPSTSRSARSRSGSCGSSAICCGKVQMVNEAHMKRGAMPIRDIIARMPHVGCSGTAGKAELLTGIEGVSIRPVRKIVL